MKKTIIEKQEKQLRAKLHVLKSKLGMSDDEYRLMLVDNYGVVSSVYLSAHQLIDLINTLEKLADPEIGEMDKWRKRVIASIAGYLEMSGIESSVEKAKAIACRASGHKSFNSIPKQDLISVYNAFKNKQKIAKNVEKMSISNELPAAIITAPRVYA